MEADEGRFNPKKTMNRAYKCCDKMTVSLIICCIKLR